LAFLDCVHGQLAVVFLNVFQVPGADKEDTMSERHYRQLRKKDREAIEEMLGAKRPISAIAKEIGCSPATISREVMRNRRDDGYRKKPPKGWGNGNVCLHRRGCAVTGLCARCTSLSTKGCATCSKDRCKELCGRFEEEVCEQIAGSPHVCNGCALGGGCRLHRFRYCAKDAQAMAEGRSRESREGIGVSAEDLKASVGIIRAGIEKGQGIDHIFLANTGRIAFSRSSFYRYMHNRDISIIPIDLPKAVKYKRRDKAAGQARPNMPPEVLKGRAYQDFLALDEDEQGRVVECDCLEGPSGECCALLTMHFKALHFQIAFKLDVKDSSHVLRCFEWLRSVLEDDFSRYFGILKFDRGCEFANVLAIEALGGSGTVKAFYTDARHPEQKGACEKNHVEIRKVIKKGASLASIGAWELSFVMSHVNSSLRHSIFGKSPMQLAMGILPKELLDQLGYELMPPDEVILLPSLLDMIKRPSG
jgi:IS30 family transposase